MRRHHREAPEPTGRHRAQPAARHGWPRTRRGRIVATVGLVVAAVGGIGGAALAQRVPGDPTPVTATLRAADRDSQRASRDHARTELSPSASGSPSGSASPSPSASPSASPTPSPTSAAPKPKPTTAAPKPKPTTAKPSPAAGCGSYSGNQLIACDLLPSFGFSTGEMSALVPMWNKESGWNQYAENPSSGAYGIPQALPGNKMASVASDWKANPTTQIKWGLGYIKDRYGTPSDAWAFWQDHGWY